VKLRKLGIIGMIGLAALAGVVVITACAKPPTEEMEAAREAVARAENDPDVAVYTVSTLSRAREALASMEAEALAKRYESALNYAAEAVTNAEKAINDARAAVARAREDSANAMNALRNAIVETDTAVSQGKSNRLVLDWDQVDRDFADAQTIAGEAEAAEAANRYRNVVELSNTARTALSAITSQIAGASLAVTRKK
jgi:hypothetical protein